MCVVSMVGDHYRDVWKDQPWFTTPVVVPAVHEITRAEFEELKRQVLEMRELLKRAKEYDKRNGEHDCEVDEKMDLLRKIAKLVGVSLDDVLRA